MIGKLIKWTFVLALVGAVTIFGYAIFGDFSAPSQEVTKKLVIDVD